MIIVVVFNFRWHAQYSVRIEWSCWLAISHRTHEKHLAEQIFSLHSVLYLFFVCFKFLIESIGKSLNSDSLRIIKSIIVRNLKFYRKCKILLLVELRGSTVAILAGEQRILWSKILIFDKFTTFRVGCRQLRHSFTAVELESSNKSI